MHKSRQTDIIDVVPDLNTDLLKMWIKRGLFKIEDRNPGRGKIRHYSWPEVVCLNVMTALAFSGRGPKSNSQVAELVKDRVEHWFDDWLVPPQTLYEELSEWTPNGIDDELEQEVIFFRFLPDNKLHNYKFVAKKNITYETLYYEGAYLNCGYMMQRLAQTLIEYCNL